MIYNWIDRAIHLASERFHNDNIEKIIMLLNSYPESFVNKFIKKWIHNIKYNNIQRTCDDNKPKKWVVLPSVKGVFEKITSCLKNYHIDNASTMNNNLSNIVVKGNIIVKCLTKTLLSINIGTMKNIIILIGKILE